MPYSKESTRFDKQTLCAGWRRRPYRKTCAVCGDEFHSASPFAKYCSQRCANDASIARRKALTAGRKARANKCIVCGKPIEQDDRTKVRKYCSAACKQQAYRARKASAPPG